MVLRWQRVGWSAILLWCVAGSAQAVNPPFSGTAFLHTDIITESDWSSFTSMTYTGQASRWVFDRRVNQWVFQPMHLFDAVFADGLESEIQVNPEFGGQAAATAQADLYARSVGRLPTSLRTDVQSITIHKGLQPFGGGNNNILIHTDQAIQYGEYLEEILFHEATHTSYDANHASSPGWLSAQQNDPTFISTYARDNPTQEDVAESLLPWFALRHTEVLFPFQVDAITNSIPNRLAYFDALTFQLNEPPTLLGDYNGNGVVDAADYSVWRDAMTAGGTVLANDPTPGTINESDFLYWRDHFGEDDTSESGAGSGTAVPEPASMLQLLAALCLFVFKRCFTPCSWPLRGT